MNDRTRWNGPRDERDREDYGYRQPGGATEGGQHEQRSLGGAGQQGSQQGGQYGTGQNEPSGGEFRGNDWRSNDWRSNDFRGNEWRGSRDWGDPRGDDRSRERGYGDDRSQHRDRGQEPNRGEGSWAQRAWGGSSVREGDRGLSGAPGYGESYRRDDHNRPGSQSFASGYGMIDGPNYDERGPLGRERSWSGGAGASTPGYGRGYGPDYGRDEGRGFIERAGDQIATWFGDDDAQQRRDRDYRGENHRGRGPGDYTRSDERIREDANDRLTDDHRVDARKITVSVDKGEITLAGTVPDRETKRRAEDLVEHISGAKHVQNNLRIETQGQQGGASASPWSAAQPGDTHKDAGPTSPGSGTETRSGSGTAGSGNAGSSATGAPVTGSGSGKPS